MSNFKKTRQSVCFSLLAFITQLAFAQTLLSTYSIEQEMLEFQKYFSDRFPYIPLKAFNNGPYSLPQVTLQKKSWSMLMKIPPYEHDMTVARKQWRKEQNGFSLEQCMSAYPPSNQFPYATQSRIITAEQAINSCVEKQGGDLLKPGSTRLEGLVGVFRESTNGSPIEIDYNNPVIRSMYASGRQIFWARRGQKNFSCAYCHINNAGNRLRGEVVSAALGHTAGFPTYKMAITTSGGTWISLHEQYGICYLRSGASPLPTQHPDLISLEVYQAVNDTGVTVNAPGFRP